MLLVVLASCTGGTSVALVVPVVRVVLVVRAVLVVLVIRATPVVLVALVQQIGARCENPVRR